jgi:hypothetical protein
MSVILPGLPAEIDLGLPSIRRYGVPSSLASVISLGDVRGKRAQLNGILEQTLGHRGKLRKLSDVQFYSLLDDLSHGHDVTCIVLDTGQRGQTVFYTECTERCPVKIKYAALCERERQTKLEETRASLTVMTPRRRWTTTVHRVRNVASRIHRKQNVMMWLKLLTSSPSGIVTVHVKTSIGKWIVTSEFENLEEEICKSLTRAQHDGPICRSLPVCPRPDYRRSEHKEEVRNYFRQKNAHKAAANGRERAPKPKRPEDPYAIMQNAVKLGLVTRSDHAMICNSWRFQKMKIPDFDPLEHLRITYPVIWMGARKRPH